MAKNISSNKRAIPILLIFLIVIITLFATGDDESIYIAKNPTPNWRGIVPGTTTKEEVLSILGFPDEVYECVSRLGKKNMSQNMDFVTNCLRIGYDVYKYEEIATSRPASPSTEQEIHFKDGIVLYIVEDLLVVDENNLTTPGRWQVLNVEQFVDINGDPERVTWSMRSPHFSALLFCDRGLMLHGNTNVVRWVYYFKPAPLKQCLEMFSYDISNQYPFAGSDILRSNVDPWGYNDGP